MLTLTKYVNRRLYSPAESRYITLEDVLDLVQRGEPFAVVRQKDRGDVTREVLLQVLQLRELTEPWLTRPRIVQLIRGQWG